MSYIQAHQDQVLQLFLQHLQLAGTALGLALLIAFPVSIVIARYQHLYGPVIGVLDAIYTIPSLALLALLVPIIGIGRTPALIALVAYAQLILVRNIVTGLRGVSPAVVEAATGLGMNEAQALWRVRLPLALPVIIAGLRIATVAVIGIGTVAAFVDAGGLGTLLFNGVSQNDPAQIEAGALAIAVLAIMADLLLRLVEWWAGRAAGGTA
ncbi:MAG: transporter permease [Chloroflexi bacterium]|jgi:osmoprotectant transport system permease protein|nr:transporter permease [Chloroflexota bacterium]